MLRRTLVGNLFVQFSDIEYLSLMLLFGLPIVQSVCKDIESLLLLVAHSYTIPFDWGRILMTAFDSLKKKISEDPQSFVVILGAGASVPGGLPMWEELRNRLCDRACENMQPDEAKRETEEIKRNATLWTSFSRLKRKLGSLAFEKAIVEELDTSGKRIPKLYRQLWELNVAGIITYNIDRFAVNAYSEYKKETVDFATAIEPHKYQNYPVSSNKFVFHPHGFIADAKSWVFTETERSELYSKNENHKNAMTTLLNGKNLLIIGFNPNEWSFRDLIKDVGISGRIGGYHNYYFCPNPHPNDIIELGECGISVIPYSPTSNMHEEINQYIEHLISYNSTDTFAPSIYSGKVFTESDIPSEEDIYKVSRHELRNVLNGVVAGIIPPDTTPSANQIKKLEDFYNTYVEQLHRAWLVDHRKETTNKVYGYRALQPIGKGAFGSVYEVVDSDNQRYALKVLLPEVKDNIAYLSCFRRGIRSMNILKDRGIDGMVKIHDSYEVPACIIMDYVDGVTLREAIDNRFLEGLDVKLGILERIATIIRSAHQLEDRILHRDLKPENVMIENAYSSQDFDDPRCIPQVKILDFDLSWHRGATEKTVMFGAISQGFMAPEQVDTKADKALSRSTAVDVYSIGMLMYYVLTGNNPMPNQSMFGDFKDRVHESLQGKYRYNWRCLPEFLADTIIRATDPNPIKRISLDSIINNLQIARDMHLRSVIPNSHPLVLAEIKDRIDCYGEVTATEYGRKLAIEYTSIGKRLTLATASERSKIKLNVLLERYARSSDQRDGLVKYFTKHKEKALSAIKADLFGEKNGYSTERDIQIEFSTVLPDTLSLQYITEVADNIGEVRLCLS